VSTNLPLCGLGEEKWLLVMLTPFFFEKQVKRGEEKLPMKNRVQSDD
jgi:hypothetical protein